MDKIFWNLESCKWGISSAALLGWTNIWRGTAWLSRLVLVYCCLEVVPSSLRLGTNNLLIYCQKLPMLSVTTLRFVFVKLLQCVPLASNTQKKAKMIKLPMGEEDTTAKRSVSRGGHGTGTFLNMHVHTSSHSLFPEVTVLYAVCFILLPTTVSSILGPPDFFATRALFHHLNSAQNLTKKLLIWHIPKISHLLLMLFDSK